VRSEFCALGTLLLRNFVIRNFVIRNFVPVPLERMLCVPEIKCTRNYVLRDLVYKDCKCSRDLMYMAAMYSRDQVYKDAMCIREKVYTDKRKSFHFK